MGELAARMASSGECVLDADHPIYSSGLRPYAELLVRCEEGIRKLLGKPLKGYECGEGVPITETCSTGCKQNWLRDLLRDLSKALPR